MVVRIEVKQGKSGEIEERRGENSKDTNAKSSSRVYTLKLADKVIYLVYAESYSTV